MAKIFSPVCLCLCLLVIDARPPEAKGQGKDRVYDQDLSEEEHFKEEEHNAEYDHDAFLGKEKKKFDELTPEESKERLGYVKSCRKLRTLSLWVVFAWTWNRHSLLQQKWYRWNHLVIAGWCMKLCYDKRASWNFWLYGNILNCVQQGEKYLIVLK